MLTRTPCREGCPRWVNPSPCQPAGVRRFPDKDDCIYKESAKKVTNKDVKTAFTDVLDDLDKLIDLLNTDENASASPDYESIQDSMDTHGEALNNLCSFTWDR